MSKSIWAGTCSAIVGATTIAMMAQTPPPQQTPPQTPPAQQSSKASGDRITVTGCLKAAPSSAADTGTAGTSGTGTTGSTGTTGTAGAAEAATDPANARFVLTGVTVAPAAADTTAGSTAGSTAAGSEATAAHPAHTYRLVANPASLSPHVGKKLELTGTVVEPSGPSSSASNETASAANAPELRVEAGKVLAASCQP